MPSTNASVDIDQLISASRRTITSLQAPNGAYPASPTFSAYRGFCWFRDGSFIADGASAVGEVASASKFFDWCSMVILRHRGLIRAIVRSANAGSPVPDSRMLPTRFTMDGELGTDDWWDFQLDGYGTWIWALAEHGTRHGIALDPWREAVELTVDYLVSSWERPCYDWWEEHSEHTHVSTLGCVAGGLQAAVSSGLVGGRRAVDAVAAAEAIFALIAEKGVVNGHLTKWFGTSEVDGSLAALFAPIRVFDASSSLGATTLDTIEREISAEGGVYRFRADTFFGGGRWPLLTCFYGLARAAQGNTDASWSALAWAAASATDNFDLPEQVDGLLRSPSSRQEWIDRWGSVATPLLWSHAMFLRLAAELGAITDSTDSRSEIS